MHKLKLLPYIIRYSISARDKKRMDSTGPYNMCNKLVSINMFHNIVIIIQFPHFGLIIRQIQESVNACLYHWLRFKIRKCGLILLKHRLSGLLLRNRFLCGSNGVCVKSDNSCCRSLHVDPQSFSRCEH